MKAASRLVEMGAAVDEAWRKAHYADDALADLAVAHLSDALAPVDVDALCRWLIRAPQPMQLLDAANTFGQPPFSIYESDHLVVQLLWWTTSTTAIHEHTFTGAFGVLAGSSLHTRYAFTPQRVWSRRLMVGDLAPLDSEQLHEGDVRPIRPYAGSLHSLFHLDPPSVSVVVRSRGLAHGLPQLTLYPPGLAVDAFHRPTLQVRRRTLVAELLALGRPGALDHALELVERADAYGAVELALHARTSLEHDQQRMLVAKIAEIHGEELQVLLTVSAEQRRRNNLDARREKITDPDQRLLLALLLNAPDRAHFLELVAAGHHGNDPVAWTLDTLDALQRQAAALSDDEAGLGIDLDAAARYALEAHLRGNSEAQLLAAAPDDLERTAVQKACFVLPHMMALTPLYR